jgi:ATP-dependent DNA helicase DinG
VADTANKLVQIAPAKNLIYERSNNLREHFPFAEIRGNQGPALDKLATWNESPEKFFILEGPTGFGKSPVDIACASHAKTTPSFGAYTPGAHILTPQKTLAEQYMKDFEPHGLVELKGRNNYRCDRWSRETGTEVDCETGADLSESLGMGEKCENCPYSADKAAYISNPFGTTNFAYYLNETNHAHQLPDRNLLILDEGHNTEDQILSLTDTTIRQKDCDKYGAGKLPVFDSGDNAAVLNWLDNTLVGAASRYGYGLDKEVKEARDEERVTAIRKKKSLERFLTRVNMFRNAADPGEWFVWSDWQVNGRTGQGTGTGDLYIKPLTARLFADTLLFNKAQKVLITSATILDFQTFMRNLGISRDDAQILAVDSEFPVKNRPIFYTPVGSMSYNDGRKNDHIDKTLPKMAVKIEELLTRFIAQKGIIHTNSYKINQYIVRYLQGTSHAKRIITHDSSKGARERAVADHLASKEATVLISPSMTEGLDLKEDLSRFQIICKVPYPALDPYTRARMNRDKQWYQWQTSLKLVQATGRSVRSKTDTALTYILDADFAQFIMKNNRTLPKYWLDSIIWG